MHFVCTYTLGYFFNDEYRRLHDDGDHHHNPRDTQEYADLWTLLWTASLIMVGPGEVQIGIHTRTCDSCVGKYYTSNLSRLEANPMWF